MPFRGPHWEILATAPSKSEAQRLENRFADEYGCTASPGGHGCEHALWYVYWFEY